MTELAKIDISIKPLEEISYDLQMLYEHFNYRLFDDSLPNCNIYLHRRANTKGYFTRASLKRKDGRQGDEIVLNPIYYDPKIPKDFLATLARQMVSVWQVYFGAPGRGTYKNKQWAEKMKAIGLQPTATGEPGGRETGDTVYHMILPGAGFDRAADELLSKDFALTWRAVIEEKSAEQDKENVQDDEEKIDKSGKSFRFDCPEEACKQRARSFYDAQLKCGIHDVMFERQA